MTAFLWTRGVRPALCRRRHRRRGRSHRLARRLSRCLLCPFVGQGVGHQAPLPVASPATGALQLGLARDPVDCTRPAPRLEAAELAALLRAVALPPVALPADEHLHLAALAVVQPSRLLTHRALCCAAFSTPTPLSAIRPRGEPSITAMSPEGSGCTPSLRLVSRSYGRPACVPRPTVRLEGRGGPATRAAVRETTLSDLPPPLPGAAQEAPPTAPPLS